MDKYLTEIEKLMETYNGLDRKIEEANQQFQEQSDCMKKLEAEESETKGELTRLGEVKKHKGLGMIKAIFKETISPAKEMLFALKNFGNGIGKALAVFFVVACEGSLILAGDAWIMPICFVIALSLTCGLFGVAEAYKILKEKYRYKDTDIDYEIDECERKLREILTKKDDCKSAIHEIFSERLTLCTKIAGVSNEIGAMRQERENVINSAVVEEVINEEFDKARSRTRQN